MKILSRVVQSLNQGDNLIYTAKTNTDYIISWRFPFNLHKTCLFTVSDLFHFTPDIFEATSYS